MASIAKRVYARLVVALVFLVIPTLAGMVIAQNASANAVWTQIGFLPVGTADGQVSFDLNAQGGSKRGPQALAVAPGGAAYVLDSLQQRVLVVFDGSNSVPTIALTGTIYPLDIVVTDAAMYVLDVDDRVVEFDLSGALIAEHAFPPGLTSNDVLRLAKNNSGQIALWTVNYREFVLNNLPASIDLEAGVDQKDYSLSGITGPDGRQWYAHGTDLTGVTLVAKDGSTTAGVAANGVFGTARPLGFDPQGLPYMVVEDLYDDGNGGLGVEVTVRKYGSDGSMTEVVRVPYEEFAYPPNRYVDVVADGSLYVMVPRAPENGIPGVTIYSVTPGTSYDSVANRVFDLSEESLDDQPNIVPAPISRYEARNRSLMMASTQWTWYNVYNRFIDGTPQPTDVQRPTQLVSKPDGATITGIPYYWGGFDSMWTRSALAPWTSWHGALTHPDYWGPLVGIASTGCIQGHPHCWYQPYDMGVYWGGAGIDCSGFVAAASGKYGISDDKPNTEMLTYDSVTYNWVGTVNTSIELSLFRAQPMSMFVWPGHHVFFLEYGIPGADGTVIKTLESTTDLPSPQGAKRFQRTWGYLKTYYQHHRSWWPRAQGNGPREPFVAQGGGSSCYLMKGQSVWYRFTTSGPRTVSLTEINGGDVDLYVYSGDPFVQMNLVGSSRYPGHQAESVYVPGAGTYFARAFTYSLDAGSGTCSTWWISW